MLSFIYGSFAGKNIYKILCLRMKNLPNQWSLLLCSSFQLFKFECLGFLSWSVELVFIDDISQQKSVFVLNFPMIF